MSTQRIAGVVLISGSILFLIAAFSPISRVFAEPDAAKKLETITNERTSWTVAQILFALGAIVTAAGLGLTSYHFRSIPASRLASFGVLVVVIGAGLWSWHVYLRAVNPRAFIDGTLSAWQFIAYTVLTQVGLIVVGVLLLRTEIASWVGWVVISGSVFFFIAYLIFKDMPPFVYYLCTLPIGIMMYRLG